MQRALQQHTVLGHSTTNVDLAATLGIPHLHPFSRDLVDVVNTHAGATGRVFPVFDQDAAPLGTLNHVGTSQTSCRPVHNPVTNPEIKFPESFVVLTGIGES